MVRTCLLLILLATPAALAGAQVDPSAPRLDTLPAPSLQTGSTGQGVQDLLAIYRRIEGLREVRISIEDRILELEGSALSQADREQAEVLAREVPGVIWVDNRIRVETDLRKRLAPMIEQLSAKTDAAIRFAPSLLLGLLVLAGSFLLAKWVGGWIVRPRAGDQAPFARNLVRQAVRGAIVLTGTLLALELMDATALVGAVLGAAGVLGIAVGFAFRDIVENYLAGVLLSLRQPFLPNDHVEIEGNEGRVARLTGRETVLMTLDGNHVRIPNALVFKGVMTNFSRNPRRRFVVTVGVHPDEELGPVLELGRDVVGSLRGVLAHPPCSALVHALADSTIEVRFSGWVDQTNADFAKVRSEAHRRIKERFEEADIATPPPEFGIRVLSDARPSAAGDPKDGDLDGSRRAGRTRTAESASPEPDIEPDTTIQDEIARERAEGDEDDLLVE